MNGNCSDWSVLSGLCGILGAHLGYGNFSMSNMPQVGSDNHQVGRFLRLANPGLLKWNMAIN